MIRRAIWESTERKISESCLINTEYGLSGKGYVVCTDRGGPFGLRYEFLSDFSFRRQIFRAEVHLSDRTARIFLGMTEGSWYGHIDGKQIDSIEGVAQIDLTCSLFPKFMFARRMTSENSERKSLKVLQLDIPKLESQIFTVELSKMDRNRYSLIRSDESLGKVLEVSNFGIPVNMDGWRSTEPA
ncbi:MAG: putative glycolipid-binding domain-containing protein [Thermoplasmataceae archaeon]